MQHVRQPKRLCLLNPGSAIFDLSLDPCSQQSLLSSNDESRTITISERSARDNRVTSHLSPLTSHLSPLTSRRRRHADTPNRRPGSTRDRCVCASQKGIGSSV